MTYIYIYIYIYIYWNVLKSNYVLVEGYVFFLFYGKLFNEKSIFYAIKQFYFKLFNLALVHSLIVKNFRISFVKQF